jgi:regulator of cell morphogenesis and NO signaling
MSVERALDPNITIAEVVRRYPAALGVFNAHGLDTCCGGGLPVAEAAAPHGLDLAELLSALEQVAAERAQ